MDGGLGDPMMDGQGDENSPMPPMDEPMPDEENFNADFDAEVEADENTEPEKYIQQVTGKLSQSLRKYNESLPQPDADLNKYVAGMINAQAIKGLSKEDTDEIIKKIQNGEEPQQEEPMDDTQPPMEQEPVEEPTDASQEGMPQEQPNMMEDIERIVERTIQDVLGKREDKQPNEKPSGKPSYKKKPFTSKNW